LIVILLLLFPTAARGRERARWTHRVEQLVRPFGRAIRMAAVVELLVRDAVRRQRVLAAGVHVAAGEAAVAHGVAALQVGAKSGVCRYRSS
jgi:hypothetical protein